MIYSEYAMEQELKTIIEDTFNTCESNRDEIRWLISILRAICHIPHKRTEYKAENYKLNLWQYQLDPIIKHYYKKWKM